jgi:protein-tyrosine phosphatase
MRDTAPMDRADHAPTAAPLAGAPNFRAVAPLGTADGRRLVADRIFRSDALHRLTDADLDRLAGLRIGTVLDLRRDDERSSMPTRWPARPPRDTLTFDAREDLQAVQAGSWRAMLDDPGFDATYAHRWMIDTYRRMPVALAPAVRAAAERLVHDADRPPGLLVHCTAGKDRTGFVVAMVLAAIGVPRDAILDDYLESARRHPPEVLAGWLIERAGLRPSARVVAAIETVAGVREDFLEAALERAAASHGSIEGYLDAAGVDAVRRGQLRAALLA